MNDNVHNPKHYQLLDGVEVVDVIRAVVPDFASYCYGTLIAYILRSRRKGGTEDLRKALLYLHWMIEHLDLEREDWKEDRVLFDTDGETMLKDSMRQCDAG